MSWIGARWRRFREQINHNRPYMVIFGLILFFALVFELPSMVVVVHSGEVGVVYKLFFQGTVTDYLYPEGIHFIFPWNKMYIYNTRIQQTRRTLSVLTREGLQVEIGLSIRYHPELTMIGVLHQQVGPDYEQTIAIPEVEEAVRQTVGRMSIEQLYEGVQSGTESQSSTTGTAAAGPNSLNQVTGAQPVTSAGTPTLRREDSPLIEAINKAADEASKKYVLIDGVTMTQIKIPDYVQAAIQKKVEQQQIAETQRFRIDQSEAEKTIAANEAARNTTLAKSLSADLLKLKAIEATEKLAASPNSKVIVVGNGPNSLPVILGSEK